jgi:hypothetical protein
MPVMPAKAGDGSLPIYDVPKRKEESVFGIYAWAVSLVYKTPIKELFAARRVAKRWTQGVQ